MQFTTRKLFSIIVQSRKPLQFVDRL